MRILAQQRRLPTVLLLDSSWGKKPDNTASVLTMWLELKFLFAEVGLYEENFKYLFIMR